VVRFLLIAVPFLLCNIARGQSSDRKSEDLANFVFEDALVVLTIDDLSALTKSIQSHELFSQLTEQTKSTDPFSILLNWLSAKVYVGLHRNQAIEKSGFSREEVSDAFTGQLVFAVYPDLDGLSFSIIADSDGNDIVFERVVDFSLKRTLGLQSLQWKEESYQNRLLQTCVIGPGDLKVGIVAVNGKILIGSHLDRLCQLASCVERSTKLDTCLSRHSDWVDLRKSAALESSPCLLSLFARPSALYKYFGSQQRNAFGEFFTARNFLQHCCESIAIRLTQPDSSKSKREFEVGIRTKIHEETQLRESITGIFKHQLELKDLMVVAPEDAISASFVFDSAESFGQLLAEVTLAPKGFGTTLTMKNIQKSNPLPIQNRFVWIQNADGSTSAQIPVTNRDEADQWLKKKVQSTVLNSPLLSAKFKESTTAFHQSRNIAIPKPADELSNSRGTFFNLQGNPGGFYGAVGRVDSNILYTSSVDKFLNDKVEADDSLLDAAGFQFVLDECKSLANATDRIVMIHYFDMPSWIENASKREKRTSQLSSDEFWEKANTVLIQEAGPIGALVRKTQVGIAIDLFMVKRR
jgi:hypothetical protein